MTRIDVVRRTAAVALMCLVGSAIFVRLFGVVPVLTRIWPVIILCCVGYAVGTAGGQRVQRGMGALVALVATVAGTLALGAMTIQNTDGEVGLGNFVRGLVDGIGLILAAVVPAPVNAETITAGILVTAYGALVGCLLVTTFVPASSVVPATLVFLGGLMLTQGSLMSALPFAAAFIASVVAALALMPAAKQQNKIEDGAEFADVEKVPRPGRPLRVGMVAVSALVVAVVAAALAPLTTIGDIRPAFDPHRKENFRPDTDLDGDDVVSLATKWQTLRRKDPFDVFTVTGPDIPGAVNWAINAKFDGVAWSSLTTFDLIEGGITVTDPPKPGRTLEGSTGFETGENLPGPWLPATYRPINVTGTPARADDEGTVVAGDDKGANKQYSVDFRALALRSLGVLATVQPVEQPEYGTLRELPRDFPDELRLFAASAMAQGTTPYEKVQALADILSSAPYQEQVDSIENSLDSAALLDLVMTSKKGTEAQFATAFAMMARSQGFPTRLVVGYAVPGKGSTRTVKSTDVIVYPEVQFTKIGWVPFAPGPRDLARGVPVVRKVAQQPKPEPSEKPKPTPSPTPTPTPSPSPSEKPDHEQDSPNLLRWLAPLFALLLLLGWPVFVRWRRDGVRAGLRTGSPDEQVTGAWTYTRSALQRLGAPLDPMVSAASYAADPATPPALHDLAAAVETAMYAPESVEPARANRAWQAAGAVVGAAVRSASITRRLRWWLVPWLVGTRKRT
ncbi:MAG: transglutaminase-like domain-containing protein [Candidatus Nanopelagicales bacterium]